MIAFSIAIILGWVQIWAFFRLFWHEEIFVICLGVLLEGRLDRFLTFLGGEYGEVLVVV
jgi:hypothetical protein